MTQYLDNNENGITDDSLVLRKFLDRNATLVMFNAIPYGILSFLSYGGAFWHTPQKAELADSLIDSKFGTANYWHKTRKGTKF